MATSSFLEVDKSPSDEFSLRNCAVVNNTDQLASQGVRYVKITRDMSAGSQKQFYLTVDADRRVPKGRIGLSGIQRDWLQTRLKETITVEPLSISRKTHLVGSISLEVDFYQKPKKAQPAINTDDLAPWFLQKFHDNIFCAGQWIVLGFEKMPLLRATVLQITAVDVEQLTGRGSKTSKKV